MMPDWSNTVILMPLMGLLSMINIPERFKMEGDLQTELAKLLKKYAAPIRFVRNKELDLTINRSYPKNTNLWRVFEDILTRYHLIPEIMSINDSIGLKLTEGAAWKHKS